MRIDPGSIATLVGALGSGGFLGALWQRRNQEALFRLQVAEATRVRAEESSEQAAIRLQRVREERAALSADARRAGYVEFLTCLHDLDAALTSLGFARARHLRLERRAVHDGGPGDPGRHRELVAQASAEVDRLTGGVRDVARRAARCHTLIRLVAPDPVRAAAARLMSTVDELAGTGGDVPDGDHVSALRAAEESFLEAARADVGAPEVTGAHGLYARPGPSSGRTDGPE